MNRTQKFMAAGAITMATIGGGAAAVATSSPAHASGSTISTTATSKVMVSSTCYETYTQTVTYYHHSAGKGWVAYPSAKVTTSRSEHCYAK